MRRVIVIAVAGSAWPAVALFLVVHGLLQVRADRRSTFSSNRSAWCRSQDIARTGLQDALLGRRSPPSGGFTRHLHADQVPAGDGAGAGDPRPGAFTTARHRPSTPIRWSPNCSLQPPSSRSAQAASKRKPRKPRAPKAAARRRPAAAIRRSPLPTPRRASRSDDALQHSADAIVRGLIMTRLQCHVRPATLRGVAGNQGPLA